MFDASLRGMIQNRHPAFLHPLWRRVLLIAVVAAWLAFELLVTQSPLWMMIAGGMLAYAVWEFILRWPKEIDPGKG
jgi:hypothetical protein